MGRGEKSSLKKVHEIDENSNIIKTHVLKEDIEDIIMTHNTNHFKAAHETPVHNDQIYPQLQQDNVRNKILDGTLERSECDNEDVCHFLKLLKQPRHLRSQVNRQFKEVTQEQWVREVKRAKKRSASSIFSKRTYSVHKCALRSVRMT